MNQLLQRLPEEIENEIKSLIFTKSMRLTMLLDRYPLANMETFLHGFSKEQLDRIYRYGCVSKVLYQDTSNRYTSAFVNPNITEFFRNDTRYYSLFTHACWPTSQFNTYWVNKKQQPSKLEYIRRIAKFCSFVLEFQKFYLTKNERFISYFENLVYDVVVGTLIMRKNM